MDSQTDFTIERNDGLIVLFVNSDLPPHEIIPLDAYIYKGGDTVLRLCEVVYLQEGKIKHKVLRLIPFNIKPGAHSNIKLVCDSQKPLFQFIQ